MSDKRSEEGSAKPRASKRPRKKAASRASRATKKRGKAASKRAAPVSSAVSADVKLTDADRIYAFADQINTEGREAEERVEEERPESWVSFLLAQEIYALPVLQVQEILRVGQITRVPHAPAAVLGVTNRRGRVLPVVDLRRRLELAADGITAASRVVVISAGGRLIGLLVDAVRQVESVLRSQVLPPPEEAGALQRSAMQGVLQQHGEMIVLLELDSLLEFHPLEEQRTA